MAVHFAGTVALSVALTPVALRNFPQSRHRTLVRPRSNVACFESGPQQLDAWLGGPGGTDGGEVLQALFTGCKEVAYKVRTASCDSTACFNELGGETEQLAIDLLAEQVLLDNLEASGRVAVASSHSDQVLRPLGGGPFDYSVAIEPLDGASVVDSNFAVGSVFGVWRAPTLLNVTGRELIAAGACTYGPRVTLSLAHTGRSGVHEFLLMDDFSGRHGQWVKTNTFEGMAEGRLFAPGTRDHRARARDRRDRPPRPSRRRSTVSEPLHFPSHPQATCARRPTTRASAPWWTIGCLSGTSFGTRAGCAPTSISCW